MSVLVSSSARSEIKPPTFATMNPLSYHILPLAIGLLLFPSASQNVQDTPAVCQSITVGPSPSGISEVVTDKARDHQLAVPMGGNLCAEVAYIPEPLLPLDVTGVLAAFNWSGSLDNTTTGGTTLDVVSEKNPNSPDGKPILNSTIKITETGEEIQFRQFVCTTITWSGKKFPGNITIQDKPYEGKTKGTANNGHERSVNGKTTYVDSRDKYTSSQTPQGNYPGTVGDAGKTMSDTPNFTAPNDLRSKIEEEVPGAEVKEITITNRFTTYIYKGGQLVKKVRWHSVEKIVMPTDEPHLPNGEYGGPITTTPEPDDKFKGPGYPSVEPAGSMEPQHQEAFDKFNGPNGGERDYSGAPASSSGY